MTAGKTDQEIIDTLNYYAETIEDMKNDDRNLAAHTNA